MKKLVIVESPAKAKTISKILGDNYIVKASVGHIRDLPKHSLGIKIDARDTQFEPVYTVTEDKIKVVADLVKSSNQCDAVYLASDPDREGEAIAWHLKEVLQGDLKKKTKPTQFFRVQYNEITPSAVRKAFENPHDINQPLVDAQQARRVLDRLVGYKVSPSLWRQVGKGLSAGRVQSVGLRLVCEREDEIQNFTPQPYWLLGADVAKQSAPQTPFHIKLRQIDGKKADIQSAELAQSVHHALENSQFTVAAITQQERLRRPFAPFITSTLQQAAANALGYAPNTTMSIAQKLYEGIELSGDGPVGLITYMRTDSFSIAKEAQEAARAFIIQTYGPDAVYPKERTYRNKSNAQGAHEAIRPTDPSRTPASLAKSLSTQELKIYDLIWKRFIASQMADARFSITTAKINATPPQNSPILTLSASSAQLIFPGFLQVTGESTFKLSDSSQKEKDEEDDLLDSLPPLSVGETLSLRQITDEKKETNPPARFNEASLVKALEANGIGRPSTYASILATLIARNYVQKEKRNLIPTELGVQVNTFLVSHYNDLFNVGFTAAMETQLDEVENPETQLNWQAMLRDFYQKLKQWLSATKLPSADREVVAQVLEKFQEIYNWAPPMKRGKRTFSDEQFVEEMRQLFLGITPPKKKGSKKSAPKPEASAPEAPAPEASAPTELADDAFDATPSEGGEISQNQLRALLNILLRYRPQLSNFEAFMRSIHQEALLQDEAHQPPSPSSLKIFELLDATGVEENSTAFYQSLRDQVQRGKALSAKQRIYLDRMFLSMREKIPNFSPALCQELEVEFAEPPPINTEKVQAILAGLGQVTTWNEPVKRGKRVFDDSVFFQSVSTQFSAKKTLSEPQIKVLERMFVRYRAQITNADEVIESYKIAASARKSARSSRKK